MRTWREIRPFAGLAAMFSGVVLVPLGVGLMFAGFQGPGLAIAVLGTAMRPVVSWWVRNHARTDASPR